jgi:2-oxoisovalerate dehydrogenase E2 component (dihydrolipoyl transacylase)
MTMHTIRMPDIGEGIAEVELVEWHVKPGDAVTEDQTLCDVMTDKAAVEIPSPVTGRVVELGGEIGETMAVGSMLIRIEVAGDADQDAAPEPAAPAAPAAPEAETAKATPAPSTPVPSIAATPAPAVPAPPPTATPAPTPTPPRGVASAPGPASDDGRADARRARARAAPAVRARAKALGIDLSTVTATGPDGRVVHADLDAIVRRAPAAAGGVATDATRQERVIGLRRKIAQKMQEAKRHIPHFTYVEEVDVTEMVALRDALNARHGASRGELSPLAFVVRAVVRAAAAVPQVNARYDDEAGVLTLYEAVHLGVATQTDGGLMVPVLRQAQTLDLWACSDAIAGLAALARSGKAPREALTGSTLTITSLGKLGGIVSTPVINHPEVAIVGVNRIVPRPVVRDGTVQVRQTMNLSSSFDHRVVDGAVAAAYIQHVRGLLEHPATLFID